MRYRPHSRSLAVMLEGHWDTLPPDDWALSSLDSTRRIGKFKHVSPGTLAYTQGSRSSLKAFREVTDSNEQVAVLTDLELNTNALNLPVLRVPNVDTALDALSLTARESYNGTVIAVTGSAGKTTTRSMLRRVLKPSFTIYQGKGNYLSGLRSHAFNLDKEEIGLFEVASISLPGAENFLQPHIAIITSIGEAHVDRLGSLEGVARTKSILFEGLGGTGTAIINADSPHSSILTDKATHHAGRIFTYGEGNNVTFQLVSYDFSSGKVVVNSEGESFHYILGLPGKHNALNSLAVLGALRALGLDLNDYLDRFEELRPVAGRGKVSELELNGRSITLVDQAYNANPTSMRAALESFGEAYQDRRKVLVLGDMLELGSEEWDLHRGLVKPILASGPDKVFLVGPLMGSVWPELPDSIRSLHSLDAAPVAACVKEYLQDGDVVLLKASNGTGLADVAKEWRSVQ